MQMRNAKKTFSKKVAILQVMQAQSDSKPQCALVEEIDNILKKLDAKQIQALYDNNHGLERHLDLSRNVSLQRKRTRDADSEEAELRRAQAKRDIGEDATVNMLAFQFPELDDNLIRVIVASTTNVQQAYHLCENHSQVVKWAQEHMHSIRESCEEDGSGATLEMMMKEAKLLCHEVRIESIAKSIAEAVYRLHLERNESNIDGIRRAQERVIHIKMQQALGCKVS